MATVAQVPPLARTDVARGVGTEGASPSTPEARATPEARSWAAADVGAGAEDEHGQDARQAAPTRAAQDDPPRHAVLARPSCRPS